ncbi:MAG TPA: hypothetical protein VNT56_02010 [Acidimicrobiales bacterium]|nr:hypothetical protein [Acidimicrobiales bacterium]
MSVELVDVAVFAGYGVTVLIALAVAVMAFRSGDGRGPPDRPGTALGERSRAWWRRWR